MCHLSKQKLDESLGVTKKDLLRLVDITVGTSKERRENVIQLLNEVLLDPVLRQSLIDKGTISGVKRVFSTFKTCIFTDKNRSVDNKQSLQPSSISSMVSILLLV